MEKSATKLSCYYKKKFKNDYAFRKKNRNRRYRWWCWWMDIDQQKNRNYSYLMGGFRLSLKSKWRTKEKKYECTSKMVLLTIWKESSNLSCRYSCWSRSSWKLSRKNIQIHIIKWSLSWTKLFRTASNSKYGWN